jgi:AGCS family alanine or glycine:cation symporter
MIQCIKLVIIFIFLLALHFYGWTQTIPEKKSGLDERINEKFAPTARKWESIVFYTVCFRDSLKKISVGEARIYLESGKINLYNEKRTLIENADQLIAARQIYIKAHDGVYVPIVVILLVAGALFFTIYFSFINIRRFPLAIRVTRGMYDDIELAPDAGTANASEEKVQSRHGEVNHFQALATAVSGTVGLGNIAGVAVAISIGGPGATFWMILCGLLGMSTKFVECTLGVKYRDIDSNGIVYGGPMYYLSKGLKEKGWPWLGKILAIVFAILCVGGSLGGGNAFQANQATAQIVTMTGMKSGSSGFIVGVLMALLVGIVIIGGIKRIARVTEKIVPLMAILYIAASLFIIFAHFSIIDDAFALIVKEAFEPSAGLGGVAGVLIMGFRRAVFSNEAGAGSAAIAHSAVRTKYPASEGIVALLEPFIDTVVICTMTALVIVIYNMNGVFTYGNPNVEGVDLTSAAYNDVIPNFSYVLTVAIILFAFSTMISWSYYGLQAWKYLFGRSRVSDLSFKLLFLAFIIIGSSATLGEVIRFSDAMILAMVFPNMVGLFILFPEVKKELKKYLKAIGAEKK